MIQELHTIILTGERGQGKTTFARELSEYLRLINIPLCGILAPGYWKNDERDKFELLDLRTRQRIVFCQRTPQEGWEKIRNFYINPKGQEFGEKALEVDSLQNKQVVVVDEIGPFELQGKGWDHALRKILQIQKLVKVLVIRSSLVQEIVSHYKLSDHKIIEISKHKVEDIIKIIDTTRSL